MSDFQFYDFFAGAGLVNLGMGERWHCSWANDRDMKKAQTYKSNFESISLQLGDVKMVSARELPMGADMAWASFPCQDLSLAGWQSGMSAERSGTFWAFWRIMRDLYDLDALPPMLVIENVTGLLAGANFEGLCEALAGLGLRFGAILIDAKQFVPQSRRRVFVVAVDERADTADYEIMLPSSSMWHPKAVQRAHEGLPEALKSRWIWWSLPIPTGTVPSIESIVEIESADLLWHSPEETSRIVAMMSVTNRAKLDCAERCDGPQIGLLYKRIRSGLQRAEVRFDGIAGCIRTSAGGSSRQTVIVINEKTVRSRLLSPREAARLMGVDDSYKLPTSYSQAYNAMGDGVVVPAVAWLSNHLLTPLADILRHRTSLLVKSESSERIRFRDASDARANRWHSAHNEISADHS